MPSRRNVRSLSPAQPRRATRILATVSIAEGSAHQRVSAGDCGVLKPLPCPDPADTGSFGRLTGKCDEAAPAVAASLFGFLRGFAARLTEDGVFPVSQSTKEVVERPDWMSQNVTGTGNARTRPNNWAATVPIGLGGAARISHILAQCSMFKTM